MKQSFFTRRLGKWPRHRARFSARTKTSGLYLHPNLWVVGSICPSPKPPLEAVWYNEWSKEGLGIPTPWVSVLVPYLAAVRSWANCVFKNPWLWYWYLLSRILVRIKWHDSGRVQRDWHSVDVSYRYHCVYWINTVFIGTIIRSPNDPVGLWPRSRGREGREGKRQRA